MISAVIFDLGGVVLGSPFGGFARLEGHLGLPEGTIADHILSAGEDGAFFRLERGDLATAEFPAAFAAETRAAGTEIDGALVLDAIGESTRPRRRMLEAVEAIEARGLRVGVITNNWRADDAAWDGLRDRFDVFVESHEVGLRKPDPRIYRLACDRLGVEPSDCVFLDDIGSNLKPARAMGMTTIKVDDPADALAELSEVLGFEV